MNWKENMKYIKIISLQICVLIYETCFAETYVYLLYFTCYEELLIDAVVFKEHNNFITSLISLWKNSTNSNILNVKTVQQNYARSDVIFWDVKVLFNKI